MRTLEEMGIGTVAVYSEADRDAPHARRGAESYLIGPGPPNQSYLGHLPPAVIASGAGPPGRGRLLAGTKASPARGARCDRVPDACLLVLVRPAAPARIGAGHEVDEVLPSTWLDAGLGGAPCRCAAVRFWQRSGGRGVDGQVHSALV